MGMSPRRFVDLAFPVIELNAFQVQVGRQFADVVLPVAQAIREAVVYGSEMGLFTMVCFVQRAEYPLSG